MLSLADPLIQMATKNSWSGITTDQQNGEILEELPVYHQPVQTLYMLSSILL